MLNETISTLKTNLQESNLEVESLKTSLEIASASGAVTESAIAQEFEKRQTELEKKVSAMKSELSQKLQEISQREAENQDLKQKLAEAEKAQQSQIANRFEGEKANAEFVSRMEKLQAEKAETELKLRSEISELRTTLENAEKKSAQQMATAIDKYHVCLTSIVRFHCCFWSRSRTFQH